MTALDVLRDGVVEAVAGHAHGLGGDDAEHRDHGGLGASAADVDDHVASRRADRDLRADGGGERLRDEVRGTARASGLGGVADGALLDVRHADGDGDHHLRPHEADAAHHAADEVAQHRFGDEVVGDHAVAHGADDLDRAGVPADHRVRLVADGDDGVVALGEGDDRRLVEHDAAALLEDEDVRGAEVDADALREHLLPFLGLRLRRIARARCL